MSNSNAVYLFQLIFPDSETLRKYTHIIIDFNIMFVHGWIFEQIIEYNGFLTEV